MYQRLNRSQSFYSQRKEGVAGYPSEPNPGVKRTGQKGKMNLEKVNLEGSNGENFPVGKRTAPAPSTGEGRQSSRMSGRPSKEKKFNQIEE